MDANSSTEERNIRSILDGILIYNQLSSHLFTSATNVEQGSPESGDTALQRKMMESFLDTLTDDMKWTSMNGYVIEGKQAVAEDVLGTFQTFPNNRVVLPPEFLEANADTVSLLYIMTGDRVNGFMGLPPMSIHYEVTIAAFNRFDENGKRTEAVFVWNPLELYFQLGFSRFTILQGYKYPPGSSVPPFDTDGSFPRHPAEWHPGRRSSSQQQPSGEALPSFSRLCMLPLTLPLGLLRILGEELSMLSTGERKELPDIPAAAAAGDPFSNFRSNRFG